MYMLQKYSSEPVLDTGYPLGNHINKHRTISFIQTIKSAGIIGLFLPSCTGWARSSQELWKMPNPIHMFQSWGPAPLS